MSDPLNNKLPVHAVQSLAECVAEEMEHRGWKATDVAARMTTSVYAVNICMVNLMLAVQKDNLLFDDDFIQGLSDAFDISFDFFKNLDTAWRENPSDRDDWLCPEYLFDGLIFPQNDNGGAS